MIIESRCIYREFKAKTMDPTRGLGDLLSEYKHPGLANRLSKLQTVHPLIAVLALPVLSNTKAKYFGTLRLGLVVKNGK